jgi:hypothetical protein
LIRHGVTFNIILIISEFACAGNRGDLGGCFIGTIGEKMGSSFSLELNNNIAQFWYAIK